MADQTMNARKRQPPELDVPPVRPDGLQLDEARAFQRSFWTAERWAWVVFAAIIVVALAGLTGASGPLARTSLTLSGGQTDLPRIARLDASETFEIVFGEERPVHRLVISKSFADYFQIEDIQPQPQRSLLLPDARALEFPAEAAPPHRVTIYARARRAGLARYAIGLDGPAIAATTLILP
jgi:hypothetical protein